MTKYKLHKQNIPCERCGEKDIRLYHEYSTFKFSSICMDCLEKTEGVSRQDMLDRDSSEWWVPMLPTKPDNDRYCFGFTSSTDEAILHFHSLKNSKDEDPEIVLQRFKDKLHEFKKLAMQWEQQYKNNEICSSVLKECYTSRYAALKTFNEMLGLTRFEDWC